MDHFKIYQANINDLEDVLILASLLFNKPIVKLKYEFENILKDQKYAVFVLKIQQLCIGLAYVSIRYDYVEGSSSAPVGYLEGIYIRENFRKKYYAKKLLTYCEQWILNQKISEFASDCELQNVDSFDFHMQCGFKEVNKIICFIKKLN